MLATRMINAAAADDTYVTICNHVHVGVNSLIMNIIGLRDNITPGMFRWLQPHSTNTLSDIITYDTHQQKNQWSAHSPQ